MSNFKLALVEIYNPQLHGYYDNNEINSNIYSQYLIIESLKIDEFYDDIDSINWYISDLNNRYYHISNQECSQDHPTIQNYKHFIHSKKYIKFEIIQENPILLDKEDVINSISPAHNIQYSLSCAIKKTFWIKIFQKKWRNFYKNKLNFMKNLNNLKYRELHGSWPKEYYLKYTF